MRRKRHATKEGRDGGAVGCEHGSRITERRHVAVSWRNLEETKLTLSMYKKC